MRLRHDGGVSTLPDAEPLITLLALHEAGSESLAAEVLGVGQSAVSRRIASLQRLTREPLTVRTASGTKLTPAGERLLPFARDARAALQGAARWLAGDAAATLPLRLGVDPDLTPRLAGRLAALGRDGAPLAVDEAWSRELVEAVRRGDVDAAAVLWAPAGAEPGLTTEDLPPDDVVLVAAAGARLLRGDAPDPDVVAASPLLMPPEGSEVAGRARAELRALGLEPARVVTLGSAAAVRAGVSAGAGLGLGLASAFEAEVAAGWLTAARLGPGGALRPRLVVSDRLPPAVADEVREALGLPRRLPAPAGSE